MKRKYQVISSVGENVDHFNGITFDYVLEDDSIGRKVKCLGGDFTITQNGDVLVLVNPTWVLTILRLPEEEKEESKKLEVNKDFEIFTGTKRFKLNETDLVKSKKVTYKDFYEAVKKEWPNIEKLTGEPLPLKFNDQYNSLVFINDWEWEGDDFKWLVEGSWGRETKDGRSF
jgi:hypothetical protein